MSISLPVALASTRPVMASTSSSLGVSSRHDLELHVRMEHRVQYIQLISQSHLHAFALYRSPAVEMSLNVMSVTVHLLLMSLFLSCLLLILLSNMKKYIENNGRILKIYSYRTGNLIVSRTRN